MSGSPKYSSVSYNAQAQRAREHERIERDRQQRQLTEDNRKRAEAGELRQQASHSAGALAAVDTELAHVQRGVQFAPRAATTVSAIAAGVEAARGLYRRGKFTQVDAEVSRLRSRLATMREVVEREAERLALRVVAVEALSTGLQARGYDVGEVVAQSDGTVALRARLVGIPGIDLAVVDNELGDELVMRQHDATTPLAAAVACPSLVALHADLRSELATLGIELGGLSWDEAAEALEESDSRLPTQERGRSK